MNRSSTKALMIVLTLTAAGGAVWFFTREQRRTAAPEVTRDRADSQLAMGTASTTDSTDDAMAIAARHAEQPRPGVLYGRVVDPSGTSAPGARVSWTTMFNLSDVPVMNWTSIDRATIAAGTIETATDERGEFAFETLPSRADELGSVLWVTCSGHQAELVPLPADMAQHPEKTEIRLRAGAMLRARVVDASDVAIPRARVFQIGLAAPAREARDAARTNACRLYSREWTTDANGEAALPKFDGYQVVLASHGGLEAQPWLARDDTLTTEIVLRLVSTFTVVGRVRVADSAPISGRVFVSAFAEVRGALARLGQARVAEDSSFGPLVLPSVSAERLKFDLAGGDLEPRVRYIETPAAGATIELEFDTQVGSQWRFHVVDEGRAPVSGASVALSAFIEDAWVETNSRTDAAGLATVGGGVGSSMNVRVDAAGFVTNRIENVLAPLHVDEPMEIVLAKAAVVEGKCVRSGLPVRDFEVLFWTDDPRLLTRTPFLDRADGSFRIESAPVGSMWIMPSSNEVVGNSPQRVSTSADSVTTITLELSSGSTGFGRVIDATTGEGVSGAIIKLWSNVGPQILTRSGLGSVSEHDGSFELRGFPDGDSRFEVAAPGYALKHGAAFIVGARCDLGLIPLASRQVLEVQLTSHGELDFAQYRLTLRGDEHVPERRFDATGNVLVKGLAPGEWEIGVGDEAGNLHVTNTELAPGADWRVEMPLGGRSSLTVRVEPRAGEELAADLELWLAYEGALGRRANSFVFLPTAGVLEVDFLDGKTVTVDVVSPKVGRIGGAHVKLKAGRNEVVVRLGEKESRIRVVSERGEPIQDVQVVLTAPSADRVWNTVARTDDHGLASFIGLPFERLVAALWQTDYGTRIEIPFEASSGYDEPAELVLHARASVRVELRDGAMPLPGVGVRLTDGGGAYNAFEGASDANARVEVGRLAEGTFQLVVSHPGLWPTQATVHAFEESPDEIVQVRRLGSIEFTVRNSAGAAVADAPIALRSLEFDHDVAEWIAAGRVAAPQGLRTNASGVLRIDGIPRGDYRWSLGEVAGSASVPAHASVAVPVIAP